MTYNTAILLTNEVTG